MKFSEISFLEKKDYVRVKFYERFAVDIPKEEILRIGNYKIENGEIEFPKLALAEKKLLFVIQNRLIDMKTIQTGNSATYVHASSGIPLIGNIAFGIIDRGSSLIEVKPMTSCILNCIYCSLKEGQDSCKHDFLVQKDYLVEELRKVVAFKNTEGIELHINCHGEALLYGLLDELISDMKAIPNVETISMNTNGVMLTPALIRKLKNAGLTRFNISFNSLNKKTASKMAGCTYPVEKVVDAMKFIRSIDMPLVIAPLLLQGYNDEEMPELIKFAKEIGAKLGIQNFLEYKHGRKPAKQFPWEKFEEKLKQWEKDFDIKLLLGPEDFKVIKTSEMPKPFKKGEIIKGRVLCPGRYNKEKIISARDRSISVITKSDKVNLRAEIVRIKHNIYLAKEL